MRFRSFVLLTFFVRFIIAQDNVHYVVDHSFQLSNLRTKKLASIQFLDAYQSNFSELELRFNSKRNGGNIYGSIENRFKPVGRDLSILVGGSISVPRLTFSLDGRIQREKYENSINNRILLGIEGFFESENVLLNSRFFFSKNEMNLDLQYHYRYRDSFIVGMKCLLQKEMILYHEFGLQFWYEINSNSSLLVGVGLNTNKTEVKYSRQTNKMNFIIAFRHQPIIGFAPNFLIAY